jgi:hypothetical protein
LIGWVLFGGNNGLQGIGNNRSEDVIARDEVFTLDFVVRPIPQSELVPLGKVRGHLVSAHAILQCLGTIEVDIAEEAIHTSFLVPFAQSSERTLAFVDNKAADVDSSLLPPWCAQVENGHQQSPCGWYG